MIEDFARKFGVKIDFDKELVVKKKQRFYLLNNNLVEHENRNFFYAGLYLGKIRGKKFFPSFILLTRIGEKSINKVLIDTKTAWLFICGRDIFRRGIVKIGNLRIGDFVLIMNIHNECLGFGRIINNFNKEKDSNKVIIKNILDIGDFLRRERKKS